LDNRIGVLGRIKLGRFGQMVELTGAMSWRAMRRS